MTASGALIGWAQAVRGQATAIPELVAWGSDWLITPLAWTIGHQPTRDVGAVPDQIRQALAGCDR